MIITMNEIIESRETDWERHRETQRQRERKRDRQGEGQRGRERKVLQQSVLYHIDNSGMWLTNESFMFLWL